MSTVSKTFFRTSAERLLVLLFGIAPLFLVTVRSWSNAVLIFGFIFSLLFLLINRNSVELGERTTFSLIVLLILTLIAPICSVALSSYLRGDNHWSNYDSASRFFVAIFIFAFALSRRINIANYFQYTAPISLILTLLHQSYFVQPKLWGSDRMSTYFSDPLVFGYTSLTLGLMSFASINIFKKDSKSIVAFKLFGTSIGFYLSIMSGSRTGWVAVPIVIAVWLYLNVKGDLNKTTHFIFVVFATALVAGLFFFSSTVNHRIGLALQEIADYSWTGFAPETSVGLRITFLRLAWDMFWSHPFVGFGETSNVNLVFPAHIYTYATSESIRVAVTAGFHNEMVTNAIRYGIFGLFATFFLFASPLFLFLHQIHSDCVVQRGNAILGTVFTICFFVSSLSTEVFDLKYTASFYALMIVLFCASSLSKHSYKAN